MGYPSISSSSSSPNEADQFSPGGHAARSRTRLDFLDHILIYHPGTRGSEYHSVGSGARSEARRKELQNLWPTVFRILEQSPSLDLLALNPAGVANEVETFHGFGVLGRATIRDTGDIKTLAEAFLKGRREGGEALLCFDPRHGIHIRQGDQDLDLVICFECEQGYLYFGSFNGRWFGVSESPRPSFDQVFKKAGLQIAK